MSWFARRHARRASRRGIDPDEVFLDSANLPGFEDGRPEGRIETPISLRALSGVGWVALAAGVWFAWTLFSLQIVHGEENARKATENSLRRDAVFASRGTIYDRNGAPMAWDEPRGEGELWSRRGYLAKQGLGLLLGYVSYPKRDAHGRVYDAEVRGQTGVEAAYDSALRGQNGARIVEETARGASVSESLVEPPRHGDRLDLALDAEAQLTLHRVLAEAGDKVGFKGGAAGVMDMQTGEVLALVSFPDYDPAVMSAGEDRAQISAWLNDPALPLLNRATQGVFTPGSIVKPFFAAAALEEKTLRPETTVYSDGTLEVPNPYYPDKPSLFNDWKALGLLDLRGAIAWSSDIYFYTLGGGFGDIPGVGIAKLERYAREFGFGEPMEDLALRGPVGTVPSPSWKEAQFDGEPWRLGDTYFTSIGQYGFQVSLVQALRSVSGVATGRLVEPSLVRRPDGEPASSRDLGLDEANLQVVREGMRQAVTDGTAKAINLDGLRVAAKTGTAELGVTKALVNSWVIGYFPYEKPRYAFAVVMERGDRNNLFGASPSFRPFLEWVAANRPSMALGGDPDAVEPKVPDLGEGSGDGEA